jgi:hypothetical protein
VRVGCSTGCRCDDQRAKTSWPDVAGYRSWR